MEANMTGRARKVTPTARKVRAWALCGAVLLAVGPLAAHAQAAPARESLTLNEAIARALQHNPNMVAARGATQEAAAAQKSASGAYLPTLSASASTSASGSTAGTNWSSQPGLSAGLSLNYDVFTGFRRGAQDAQADAQAAQAAAGLSQKGASTALGVEQTFLLALKAKDLVDVATSRMRTAQEGLDAAKRKVAAGLGTQSDALRAQVELNSAQQALLEAQTDANTQAYALGRQVGADGPVDPALDASLTTVDPNFDVDAFVAGLSQGSPDVAAAQAALASAQAAVDAAKSRYLPQVTLGAGLDWSAHGGPDLPGDAGWSVRLGISFPIFDGFARDESLTRAQVQATTAQATVDDTKRALVATAEQLAGAVRLAAQKITLAQSSVAAADEDLRVQQDRYGMGVSTMLDLLTSQAGAVAAHTDLVSANFDYRLARAQLTALAGRAA